MTWVRCAHADSAYSTSFAAAALSLTSQSRLLVPGLFSPLCRRDSSIGADRSRCCSLLPPPQIVLLKDFHLRDDDAVRKAISKSNVVINLIGSRRETRNFT